MLCCVGSQSKRKIEIASALGTGKVSQNQTYLIFISLVFAQSMIDKSKGFDSLSLSSLSNLYFLQLFSVSTSQSVTIKFLFKLIINGCPQDQKEGQPQSSQQLLSQTLRNWKSKMFERNLKQSLRRFKDQIKRSDFQLKIVSQLRFQVAKLSKSLNQQICGTKMAESDSKQPDAIQDKKNEVIQLSFLLQCVKQKKIITVVLQYQMKVDDQSCKGFLISCDKNREKQALRDAYNFLTEHIQLIYSDVTQEHIHKRIKEDGKEINLENEVAYNKKANAKLLTQVETNVNCICFIKINPVFSQIDPLRVVKEIMKEVHEEGRQITRFCHRILPVERAFRAQHFRMIDQLEELISIHSQDKEIRSWMLNFKCRNNAKFNYKEVLKETEKITKKYGHFTDIYYPQWAISIEISNHLMCLSICQNFKQTNEYKLHKKLQKLKYTKEDNDQLERLNRQYQEEQENLRKQKQKQSQRQKSQNGQKNIEEKQEQQPEVKQNKLLNEKIEVNEDEIDLL